MRVALVGLGKTGKVVAEYLLQQGLLSMVICRHNSVNAYRDLGELLNIKDTGILIEPGERLEERLFYNQPDVLIDFSSSSFLRDNLHILAQCGVNIVTAVTDYEPAEVERIRTIADKGNIGVIMAPNITYGVNIVMLFAEIAARLMEDYDFEIIEEHHKYKKDRPSATAKKLADRITENFSIYREIALHAIRGGGIVGKHKLLICGEFDKIEITHESFSRLAFAQGAYKAAQFILGKKGFYEMRDVFAHESQQRQMNVTLNADLSQHQELA